jgi:hypothetical protein
MNFLMTTGPRPPALIAEAAMFGLLVTTLLGRAPRPFHWRRVLTFEPRAYAVVILLAACAAASLQAYIADPPNGPPYAVLLKQPQYQGASFLTSTYDGVVWSYTHGWTYMADENPPRPDARYIRFRHFADWTNDSKYERPQYFLCDNTKFGWWKPVGDCRDVAQAMAARGDSVIASYVPYALVKLNYGHETGDVNVPPGG